MKKLMSLVLALVMMSVCATAFATDIPLPDEGDIAAVKAADKPVEIKFLSYSNNPFWDQINEGLAAATEYFGKFNCTVTPVDMGNEADGKTLADYIETLMLDEPAGIVCCPMSDGTEAYVDKAVAAGITVVTYLSESNNQTVTRIAFSAPSRSAAASRRPGVSDSPAAKGPWACSPVT